MRSEPTYCSVHRALQAISAPLAPVLVAEATQARLLAFASRHPALGQTQYLEIRLGGARPDEAGQVDLLISAATAYDRDTLGRMLAARPSVDPELGALHRFVAQWCSPASILHRAVPVAWLEFDHMDRDAEPVGSVGVCLAPAYLDPYARLPAQAATEVLPALFEAVRVTKDAPATAVEHASFERCYQHLPAGARWIHLSVMVGRDPVELKLYGSFPQDALLSYLDRIGWAGDRAVIRTLLERYCPTERTAGEIYVDLPVTGMTDARCAGLGIVFAQQQLRVAREHDGRRPELLATLVGDGLCSREQAAALADWPGSGVDPAVDSPAPAPGARGPVNMHRWFDIKLAHRPGHSLLAKAYLGFVARPVREADLSAGAAGTPRRGAGRDPDSCARTL